MSDWHEALEEDEVRNLCERIGHGRVLQLASAAWQKKGREEGTPSVGMVIGPHAGLVVRCWHPRQGTHCDWCCGCGWVTEKVAKLMPKEKTQ